MQWSLLSNGGHFPWRPRPLHGQHRRKPRRCAASGDALANKGSYFDKVKGLQGPAKAAFTSGSMSACGDLLAQFLTAMIAKSNNKPQANFDPIRTLRMFGYGFCWYGPCQYYWYNMLEHLMPAKNTVNFLTKVAANQVLLGPVTLTTVFTWTAALTQQLEGLSAKLHRDLLPSLSNGWKFWVPAASLNFYCIPVQQQVLYMSCCGVLWTAYLSYASTVPQGKEAVAAH